MTAGGEGESHLLLEPGDELAAATVARHHRDGGRLRDDVEGGLGPQAARVQNKVQPARLARLQRHLVDLVPADVSGRRLDHDGVDAGPEGDRLRGVEAVHEAALLGAAVAQDGARGVPAINKIVET